jgi:uncharacterized protein YndB with AHSA1/START domain
MGSHTFTLDIAAPRDRVFDLWVNLDRAPEWIEGMAGVSDVTGPSDKAGTTYLVRFGSWSSSLSTILEAERPRYIRVKFGSWLMRGENIATFEEAGEGTRLTQEMRLTGLLSSIMGRIFAAGSYRGSFRGELNTFKRICESENAALPSRG